MSSRKDIRNFGSSFAATKPAAPEPQSVNNRTTVVLPERVIVGLLRTETARLTDKTTGRDELIKFFGHFFDSSIDTDERDSYVDNFLRQPPTITLGYPRTTAIFPMISVVMESENEDTEAMGAYLGQTQEAEGQVEAREYVGTMFESTFGVYVYAEHPDVCIYLYNYVKGVLLGAHEVMLACGLIDPHFSGGDLAPDEGYLPENMFVRVLRVSLHSLMTVPVVLNPDPVKTRITGVFATDIVVSGIRGGVSGDG